MLKHIVDFKFLSPIRQPPSGGCVLKLVERDVIELDGKPAAFGRLCVET